MDHDLLAELAGYQVELSAVNDRRPDRAAAIREEIKRVSALVVARVQRLMSDADNFEDAGQHIRAAQARVEAKRLARDLPSLSGLGGETAVSGAPVERAVRGRKGGQ